MTTAALTSSASDIILIGVSIPSSTITVSSITDSAGNTYTPRSRTHGTAISGEVWSAHVSSGTFTNLVTITLSAAVAGWAVAAGSYSGVMAFDSVGTAQTGATTNISVSVTATDPNELLVAHVFTNAGVTTSGLTPGYLDVPGAGTSSDVHQSYLLAGGASGSNSFVETLSASSNVVAVLVAIVPALSEWVAIFKNSKPELTVSPLGYAQTGVVNGGADFGPDTPNTQTSGIQEAISAQAAIALSSPAGAIRPPKIVGLSGIASISAPIDFVAAYGAATLNPVGVVVDLSLMDIQAATSSLAYIVRLAMPASFTITSSVFKFGRLLPGEATSADGIHIHNVNQSIVSLLQVAGFTEGTGILVDPSAVTNGVFFNNRVQVEEILSCANGLQTSGNSISGSARDFGCQGNLFEILHIIQCGNGVLVDGNGTGNNSMLNKFVIGVVEHATSPPGTGILDNNGINEWYVTDANSNTVDFILPASGVQGAPVLVGSFRSGSSASPWAGVNLNGFAARVTFLNGDTFYPATTPTIQPGFATPPPLPSGLGNTNKVVNIYNRTARVYQKLPATGSLGTHIVDTFTVDEALPSDPVEFHLDPGCAVYYASAVPTLWYWYLI